MATFATEWATGAGSGGAGSGGASATNAAASLAEVSSVGVTVGVVVSCIDSLSGGRSGTRRARLLLLDGDEGPDHPDVLLDRRAVFLQRDDRGRRVLLGNDDRVAAVQEPPVELPRAVRRESVGRPDRGASVGGEGGVGVVETVLRRGGLDVAVAFLRQVGADVRRAVRGD